MFIHINYRKAILITFHDLHVTFVISKFNRIGSNSDYLL